MTETEEGPTVLATGPAQGVSGPARCVGAPWWSIPGQKPAGPVALGMFQVPPGGGTELISRCCQQPLMVNANPP